MDTTIGKEVVTLRAMLRLAKEHGLWKGDVDSVIPRTFKPEYHPDERSPPRHEISSLLPHLSANSASAVAFILATGAEDCALGRALRTDVPDDLRRADVRVEVRGSKNRRRHRKVPIVTDEQRVLLEYALRHAEGTNGALFGPLHNLRRDLANAAVAARIEHLSPHALRKACGQWLIDLGLPLEIVSRILGHADTRITERVYARIKDDDVVDRMLDALDPRYAKQANRARKRKKLVPTLKHLPAPRIAQVVYDVDGVERTLTEWAKVAGIAKSTLHHRVVTCGMTMAEALARGRRGKVIARRSDCRTGATDQVEKMNSVDAKPVHAKPRHRENLAGDMVPRDGIEPPTRGFSIPCGATRTPNELPRSPTSWAANGQLTASPRTADEEHERDGAVTADPYPRGEGAGGAPLEDDRPGVVRARTVEVDGQTIVHDEELSDIGAVFPFAGGRRR